MPDQHPAPPPRADLAQICSAFAFQALIACGKMVNPMTGKYETDLVLAQYQIGVLEMLRDKTAGNRTPDEDRLFDDLLHQIHMAFVDARK